MNGASICWNELELCLTPEQINKRWADYFLEIQTGLGRTNPYPLQGGDSPRLAAISFIVLVLVLVLEDS